jgi:hypothetical protein
LLFSTKQLVRKIGKRGKSWKIVKENKEAKENSKKEEKSSKKEVKKKRKDANKMINEIDKEECYKKQVFILNF